MGKMNKMLEKFWLLVASISTIFTIVIGFQDGWQGIQIFLGMCGLAWAMYLIRRGLRKRLEKLEQNPPKKKK